MTDESVVPLRRNQSKQILARGHLSRYGKAKGSSTKLHKHNSSLRRTLTPQKSHNSTTLGLSSNESNNNTATSNSGGGEVSQDHFHDTKPSRFKPNHPIPAGLSASLSGHRFLGANSSLPGLAQSYKKGVLQLDREDDDEDDKQTTSDQNDYEDLDEDSEDEPQLPSVPGSSNDHLSIGIQPVEPTPPKLSEETVISVSSFADMASALKGARDKSGFVDSDDLISTAVNRSRNFGEMAQMVQGWNTGKRGSLGNIHNGLRSNSRANGKKRQSNGNPGDEDPREFEKVFREYTNTRAINNPVINSLYRIFKSNRTAVGGAMSESPSMTSVYPGDSQQPQHSNRSEGSTKKASRGLYFPEGKKINPLVATTANQMSDFSERRDFNPTNYTNSSTTGTIESTTTYALNKIWQNGCSEFEFKSNSDSRSKNDTNGPNSGDTIQGQALRVQQQLTNGSERNRGSTILNVS